MMPVAILAGGRGTRIAALAGDLPKALIPLAGRPFVDHQLEWLAASGVTDVVICVGYGADRIRAAVGDGAAWNLRVRYSDDGDTALGTGGAIAHALPLLGETFLVVYGDALLQCSPRDVADAIEDSDDAVMTVYRNEDAILPSNVRLADGRVAAYDKNAPLGSMTHIDYGINAFRSTIFDAYVPHSANFDLS
ncbi:MAG: NTP transferase domain-containing protein, partial [Candidatus Eremiobacteraeota bacterium]|nr:NTP transferase domain-containing protein [Candidatus Eremiobacteraeota bacterium]